MSHAAPLQVGMQPFPGYRLRQLVGRGGFADVWEAHSDDGRTLALKFLPCTDNLNASREIRSIQSLRQLKHPHLIDIEQVWAYQGYIVIAMELAEGSLLDLFDAYQAELHTPIVPEQLCVYLPQVAEALDFLNSHQHNLDGRKVGFQHCDIKPSNLLLFGDTVKVSDYGLASATSTMVRSARRAGTLDYAAPEIFQGRLSDWTDQYSLAVTYCLLRSGKLPFQDTPATFVRTYVRPKPNLTMLGAEERPIVARALAPAPQDRWPSCSEFVAQLAKKLIG